VPERAALLAPLGALERRLAESAPGIPVLAVRLPELERVAWRRGLRAARALERRAAAAFSSAALRVLRAGDCVAHEPASDVFVAALLAPTRGAPGVPAACDARSALARIAATVESATRLAVAGGWTTYDARSDAGDPHALAERALRCGERERERYAFFSSIGHELRTPLAAIRGYLETLLDDRLDAGTRERFVRIAHNESLRLGRLVDGMFEISLLDLREAPHRRAACVVGEALAAAQDACAAGAAARRAGVIVDDAHDAVVALDLDRLTLILVNVLENAIKHGRAGGAVFASVHPDARGVRITVDDDGPGIAPGDRDRVFAFGERGDTAAEGNGIGLAFVRLLVERAGGHIELRDSPLGGARFSLWLPSPPTT